MHYYQHHIGDFDKATRHLTRVERSLYRDLIDMYYDTESHLPKDFNLLAKRVLAHNEEEKTALKYILNEFFELKDEGYFNARCNEEIVKYHAFISAQSKAGKASAKHRLNKRSTSVQPTTNHKPLTTNHNNLPSVESGKPPGTTKELLTHFQERHLETTGSPVLVSWEKDGAQAKRIVTTYGLDKAIALVNQFFKLEDDFIAGAGRSFGVFVSQVNKLVGQRAHDPQTVVRLALERAEKEKEARGHR